MKKDDIDIEEGEEVPLRRQTDQDQEDRRQENSDKMRIFKDGQKMVTANCKRTISEGIDTINLREMEVLVMNLWLIVEHKEKKFASEVL